MTSSTTNKRMAVYTPISDQIKKATQKTNRRSMIAGCLLGAFVPCAVYLISHSAPIRDAGGVFGATLTLPYLVFLIAGGLVFSATSVVRWGFQAFGQSWIKAIGFVVLVEGTLIFSPIPWLCVAALIYLVAINALATGTTLALDRRKQFQVRQSREDGTIRHIEVAPPKKAGKSELEILEGSLKLIQKQRRHALGRKQGQKRKGGRKAAKAVGIPTLISPAAHALEDLRTETVLIESTPPVK